MCKFKAKEMLQLRREIVTSTCLGDGAKSLIVKIIDDARRAHEEATGCQCWYEALREMKAAA